jgi:hypothetical protein
LKWARTKRQHINNYLHTVQSSFGTTHELDAAGL